VTPQVFISGPIAVGTPVRVFMGHGPPVDHVVVKVGRTRTRGIEQVSFEIEDARYSSVKISDHPTPTG